MKKGTLGSIILALTLTTGLMLTALPVAGQSVLITIDQYQPNAVTFTTTGNFAAVNDSSQTELYGVDLVSYFTSGLPTSRSAVSGTLTPAGTLTAPYNEWIADSYQHGVTNMDLNLFVNRGSRTQSFTTSSAAFTGSVTIDLSSFLADLPSTGTMGPIYSGYGRHPGVLIGMWEVVPEPSSLEQLALGGIILFGLIAWRTRRSALRR